MVFVMCCICCLYCRRVWYYQGRPKPFFFFFLGQTTTRLGSEVLELTILGASIYLFLLKVVSVFSSSHCFTFLQPLLSQVPAIPDRWVNLRVRGEGEVCMYFFTYLFCFSVPHWYRTRAFWIRAPVLTARSRLSCPSVWRLIYVNPHEHL